MSEPVRSSRLPPAVIALGFTSFFTDLGGEMIYPMLPLFMASLGASPVFLGLIEGVADATASLLKLVSGLVSDRLAKKKPLVLLGYGVAALARPLVGLAIAPWQVLAIRVTDRVGKGLRASPRDALIAAVVPKEEAGRAFGFHQAMDHAGAVVGPLVATLLLALGWPLRSVFLAAIVPGVLSVLCVLVVREPANEALQIIAPAEETAALSPSGGVLPRSLRNYLAILALFCLGNSSDVFLLLRARELGVPTAWVPLLWAVFHVVKLVSSYLGGSWSDRTPRVKVIVLGWFIYAATYMGFGLATEVWQVWGLFIVYGVFYGLTEPAEKALVRDLSPPEIRGRAYGFYNFIVGLAAVPAGLLTGFLWEAASPLAALGTGAALALASALALLGWSRKQG